MRESEEKRLLVELSCSRLSEIAPFRPKLPQINRNIQVCPNFIRLYEIPLDCSKIPMYCPNNRYIRKKNMSNIRKYNYSFLPTDVLEDTRAQDLHSESERSEKFGD